MDVAGIEANGSLLSLLEHLSIACLIRIAPISPAATEMLRHRRRFCQALQVTASPDGTGVLVHKNSGTPTMYGAGSVLNDEVIVCEVAWFLRLPPTLADSFPVEAVHVRHTLFCETVFPRLVHLLHPRLRILALHAPETPPCLSLADVLQRLRDVHYLHLDVGAFSDLGAWPTAIATLASTHPLKLVLQVRDFDFFFARGNLADLRHLFRPQLKLERLQFVVQSSSSAPPPREFQAVFDQLTQQLTHIQAANKHPQVVLNPKLTFAKRQGSLVVTLNVRRRAECPC